MDLTLQHLSLHHAHQAMKAQFEYPKQEATAEAPKAPRTSLLATWLAWFKPQTTRAFRTE